MDSKVTELPLEKISNFRDVGKFVNQLSSSNLIASRKLYRSAKPDDHSLTDRSRLLNEFGIKTILDLRSKTELINATKKHSQPSSVSESAAVPASANNITRPLHIPGITYTNINLNGKGFERSLIWQLRFFSLIKLVVLMVLGYRTEGIAVLGSEVMRPWGLIGLGLDTLEHSGPEIKELFEVFADDSNYPILVHCTQGKDRTGLTIILVLLLCEVSVSAITADYIKSEKELLPEREERLKEIQSIGLDDSFAGCPSDFVERIISHLSTKYGGLKPYLEHIGIDNEMQASIRQNLMSLAR